MPEPDVLLQKFLGDIEHLATFSSSEKNFSLALKLFSCDAPVRASLKNIVNHSGYSSCERCKQRGSYHGAVILPKTNCEARTGSTFRDRKDPRHHKGASVLETIDFPHGVRFRN